jgi:hypothetical protein
MVQSFLSEGKTMTNYRILGLFAGVLFLTVTSTPTIYIRSLPTVPLQHKLVVPDVEPTQISQLPDDWETRKFISTYLRHGDQFDPRLNGDLP